MLKHETYKFLLNPEYCNISKRKINENIIEDYTSLLFAFINLNPEDFRGVVRMS